MNIKVKLFAHAANNLGSNLDLSLPDGAAAISALQELIKLDPNLEDLSECSKPAVNLTFTTWDTKLHDGDELAIIPPVSGG